MTKTQKPQITLTDPLTKKTADLSDPQAVRTLLAEVVSRLGESDVWKNRLPRNATERIGAQILRKAGDLKQALGVVRSAETLQAILSGTDLEEDAKKLPNEKKGSRVQGLFDEKALEKHLEDVGETAAALWEKFRNSVEESGGELKKSATIKIDWIPETEKADAFISVVGEHKVSTFEITRTSKVRRLPSGRHQLELFSSPRMEE